MSPPPDIARTIDITREICPMTYVRTKLAIEALREGEVLEVWLRGDEAKRNVPRNAREEGHRVLAVEELGERVRVLVLKNTQRR